MIKTIIVTIKIANVVKKETANAIVNVNATQQAVARLKKKEVTYYK